MKARLLRYPGGRDKAFTMSYDDGVRSDMRFSDIISAHGLKCTFNYNIEVNRHLTDEEIQKYALDRGHEIAVHGTFHRSTGMLRPIEGIREYLDCRLSLEKRFGRIIRGCAYPDSGITRFSNNVQYEDVKKYLTELDIAYARTLGGDNNSFELPQDFHAWMPTAHHNNPKTPEYLDEFLNLDLSSSYYPYRTPRLFYMWGHTYEFDKDNNWDVIETIAEKLDGREDIWFATNIEIYDYVQAYNSLVYSADGSMIYNPSLFEIWFDEDGILRSIKPGETITE